MTPEEQKAISGILKRCQHPVIVELGAYGGEDSQAMREMCGQQHALNVIVEPDHRNMEIIRQYRRGVMTVLVEAAIADYTGMIQFHTSVDPRCEGGRSGSGSIRLPYVHQKIFPDIKFPIEASRHTPCWSLDHLFMSLIDTVRTDVDLLWVDIQGAERDMIAGGQMALDHTRWLFIEAEQTELYEGQALREELLSLLPGFRVIEEFDYNLLLEAK